MCIAVKDRNIAWIRTQFQTTCTSIKRHDPADSVEVMDRDKLKQPLRRNNSE